LHKICPKICAKTGSRTDPKIGPKIGSKIGDASHTGFGRKLQDFASLFDADFGGSLGKPFT